MELSHIAALSIVLIGIVGIFRPAVLLYFFLIIPVLEYVPSIIAAFNPLELFKVGSVNVYASDYLIFLMGIFFLKKYCQNSQLLVSNLKSPISKSIIFVFLWELFIGFLSYMKGYRIPNVLRGISFQSLMLIALFIPLIEMTENRKDKFFRFSIFLGIILLFFGILKLIVFHEVELTSSNTTRTLSGNAVHIILFPLCYIIFYGKFRRRHKLFSSILLVLFAIGIHLAGHRSGWIVFAFVLMMCYMYLPSKLEYAWAPLLTCSILIMSVIFFSFVNFKTGTFIGDFAIRIGDTFNFENETTIERLNKWKLSIDIIKKDPLLGLGRYPIYTSSAGDKNLPLVQSFDVYLNLSPHNMFAAQAIYEGTFGLIVLSIFLYIVYSQFTRIKGIDVEYHNFLKVYISSFIIFSMFNTSFNNLSGRIYLFVILGLLNSEIVRTSTLKER